MADVANEVPNIITTELVGFHQFIGELLKIRDGAVSPEEALDLWRADHPLSEEFEDSVEALREAFGEVDAGVPGVPAEQFFREFRERHNLPPRT